jgi:hypothetical protein
MLNVRRVLVHQVRPPKAYRVNPLEAGGPECRIEALTGKVLFALVASSTGDLPLQTASRRQNRNQKLEIGN